MELLAFWHSVITFPFSFSLLESRCAGCSYSSNLVTKGTRETLLGLEQNLAATYLLFSCYVKKIICFKPLLWVINNKTQLNLYLFSGCPSFYSMVIPPTFHPLLILELYINCTFSFCSSVVNS